MTLPPDNLGFEARSPSGGEGCVVLLFRPEGGRVAYREWRGDLPARDDTAAVDEVEARVRAWARQGWTLTESPERIAAWLRSG